MLSNSLHESITILIAKTAEEIKIRNNFTKVHTDIWNRRVTNHQQILNNLSQNNHKQTPGELFCDSEVYSDGQKSLMQNLIEMRLEY